MKMIFQFVRQFNRQFNGLVQRCVAALIIAAACGVLAVAQVSLWWAVNSAFGLPYAADFLLLGLAPLILVAHVGSVLELHVGWFWPTIARLRRNFSEIK